MDLEDTEDEDEEAITPPSTLGREDPRWSHGHGGRKPVNPYPSSQTSVAVEDDDMMKAALALCGLGGRRV